MAQNERKSTVKAPKQPKPRKTVSSGDMFLHKLQMGFEKNQKAIVGTIAVVAIAVGGYFGYKYFIQAPKEEKAATALSYAQQWFEVDSFNYVLNGNGLNNGVLDVIKKYDGTKSGNLAHYYAGVSYLNTHDFKNAIQQLSEFDGEGTPVQYLAYGALGDAYMESKDVEKGIEFYKKAASDTKNKFIAPLYLFRAGLACELNGKKDEAKKLYKQIKDNYPYSQQGQEIDKYLARVGDVSLN